MHGKSGKNIAKNLLTMSVIRGIIFPIEGYIDTTDGKEGYHGSDGETRKQVFAFQLVFRL